MNSSRKFRRPKDDNMVDKRVEEAEAAQKAAENKDADNQAGQPAAEKGTDSGDSAAEGTQQKKDDDTIKVEIESKPIVEITSSSSNQ